jgi:hypothetical protein
MWLGAVKAGEIDSKAVAVLRLHQQSSGQSSDLFLNERGSTETKSGLIRQERPGPTRSYISFGNLTLS